MAVRLVLFALLVLSCSKDQPAPVAPAGKSLAALAAPTAPTNLRFDAPTDSSCTVRWDASDGATDYDVNYKTASGGRWTNEPHAGDGLYNTIHDLEPGTAYRWAVRAENGDGASAWAFGPNFTTRPSEEDDSSDVPAAPTNLRFDAPTDSSCTVRWNASAGSTDYDVAYMPASGGRWQIEPHAGDGLYNTIHDLEPGTAYRWAVRAENGNGASAWVFGPNFTTLSDNQSRDETGGDGGDSAASDRDVLVALYHATGGDNWERNDDWLSNKPLDEWYGVTTNAQGRVTHLKLFRNSLRGPIPPQLGNLEKLEDLRLGGNFLRGPIPPELGNLSNLRNWYMANSQVTGPIPPELGNLKKLERLGLFDNHLRGPIPPELGQLTNLIYITIGGNQLTGCLPSAWRDVHVDQSSDRGNLGLSLCSEATTTRESSASDRAALVALYHATNGDHWDYNDNWLSNAPLGEWIGVDTDAEGRVRSLWMTGNNLRGTIPPELFILDKLERLRLNLNQLSGPIPPELGNLNRLKWLLLGDNQLTGPIPAQLGNLSNLIQLSLSDNRLTGSIPSQLGNLDKLALLSLQNNQLTGPIPSQLGQLTNLVEIELSGNRLTGCLPSAWSDMYDHQTDFDKMSLPFCGDSGRSSGSFNIELVYLDNGLSSARKNLMAKAARRWEQVIIGDLPDISFRRYSYNEWDDLLQARIRVSDTVDDVRIFVRVRPIASQTTTGSPTAGTGFNFQIRASDSLPILSAILLNSDLLDDVEDEGLLEKLMLHELGHCLGVGISWDHFGLLYNSSRQNHTADTYFAGFQARRAFDQLGGRSYRGRKVPVQQGGDDVHWRTSVFGDELMTLGWTWPYHAPLSRITVASLEDIGYEVNLDAADAYRVPSTSAAKPVADETRPGCQILHQPIHVVAEDGRVLETIDP